MGGSSMGYWRIWFTVYEDDKPIGAGVWHRAYAHKSSAVRRAKQMWDKDVYSPMTGTTIKRKWIVSQTNPWSANVYDHDRVLDRLHATLGE